MKKLLLLAFGLLSVQLSTAQYYDWGNSPVWVKWRKIDNGTSKIIFPAPSESAARRVLWYLDSTRTDLRFGFTHGEMRSPVVLHSHNMQGNGMVMWAPRRIELLTAPNSSYSEPWLKQLTLHEARHNVQYNNLRRGLMRPLTWLLGEQIAFLGVAQFSIFVLEGDAVMAETEMSAFGRGLQPSWTMHYRAMEGEVGSSKYSTDYWFSGSFRAHVPDHYRLGYQMVRWSYNHFGKFIWDDIARYVARNPQWIVPMSFGLRKHYDLSEYSLFSRTFAELNHHWASLPRVSDSSRRIVTPHRAYTTYQWPTWVNDSTLVAVKKDLKSISRLVQVDSRTGREKTLTHTGIISSRPIVDGSGVVWWTEFRQSALWGQKVDSRLVAFNPATGLQSTQRPGRKNFLYNPNSSGGQIFFPTPMSGDNFAYVAYQPEGLFNIMIDVRGPWGYTSKVSFPPDVEITDLAWDNSTNTLYYIGLTDAGMYIGMVDGDTHEHRPITEPRHITISDLRAADGKLYFGSIASGKDEAHMFDLTTGTEYRLSTSAFGSFQPSVPRGGKIALTSYDREGYHLATQEISLAVEVPQRALPLDIVNPQWKRWPMVKMDSLVYTATEATSMQKRYRSRRFSKLTHIFNIHSWLPLDLYPPQAMNETNPTVRAGATLISQSLLSDAVSWFALGFTDYGTMVRGGLTYKGLGPTLTVEGSLGGAPQVRYTALPRWVTLPKKSHAEITVGLSLPLTLSSGRWVQTITPAVQYDFNNGVIYSQRSAYKGELIEGIERLVTSLSYVVQRRMAHAEVMPRWGLGTRLSYYTNPTNDDFYDIASASVVAWVPGVVRPHSTRLRAAWQRSVGEDRSSTFQVKELFPRGALYNFNTRQWRAASVDYQFPLWHPEDGIPGVIYFKRLRLNLFGDYARWKGFAQTDPTVHTWKHLWSWGGDIIIDANPLRIPATNDLVIKLSLACPSDTNRLFYSLSFNLPF